MDGTRGRLYCSSCHATASRSQSLGCKMERGSPGRGDSQDITVKGFVVTRCYWLNYISPLWLRSAAFCSRLYGAGFSLSVSISLWVSLSFTVSHTCSFCVSLFLPTFHTNTHIFCHTLLTHTNLVFFFSLIPIHQKQPVSYNSIHIHLNIYLYSTDMTVHLIHFFGITDLIHLPITLLSPPPFSLHATTLFSFSVSNEKKRFLQSFALSLVIYQKKRAD